MRRAYVGVTGFMDRHEAEEALEAMPYGDRLLMIGVLASDKTRQGMPNKYPNRYPKIADIASIFPDHKLALNMIHYHTKERKNLYGQLAEMTFVGGHNVHGLQLNIAWPDQKELERYRKSFPLMQLILQVGNHALDEIGNSPRELSSKIGDYAGLIDYVLIDPSGGQGKALDPAQARDYILALKTRGPRIVLGVAGGLSPHTHST